jgi:H+/gluconate symporter-like permease
LSARDAFLYLVMFGMLYFGAYHLGNLAFQFVNLAFPDPTGDRRVPYELRWSTSAIIVSFPIFFFAAAVIARSIRRDPLQRNSAVRKWLTYLTLAVAAFIVAGDLIYLLNSLLAGEFTARFVLKCLIVGVIAGAVFGYYLWSLRHDDRLTQT